MNNLPQQKEKKPPLKRRLIIIAVILAFSAAFFVVGYLRQEKEMERISKEQAELTLIYEAEVRKGNELEEQNNMVGSDRFIEDFARDKLGLVRPDEIIFIHD